METLLTTENASETQLRDYADYVEDKIAMDEMPFTLQQWQQANIDCAEPDNS